MPPSSAYDLRRVCYTSTSPTIASTRRDDGSMLLDTLEALRATPRQYAVIVVEQDEDQQPPRPHPGRSTLAPDGGVPIGRPHQSAYGPHPVRRSLTTCELGPTPGRYTHHTSPAAPRATAGSAVRDSLGDLPRLTRDIRRLRQPPKSERTSEDGRAASRTWTLRHRGDAPRSQASRRWSDVLYMGVRGRSGLQSGRVGAHRALSGSSILPREPPEVDQSPIAGTPRLHPRLLHRLLRRHLRRLLAMIPRRVSAATAAADSRFNVAGRPL